MSEDFGSQVAVAGVATYIIEWMKNNKFIPLAKDTDHLNRAVSAIFAFVTAIGMTFAFNAQTGSFMLTGNVHDIFPIIWKAFQSFVYQTMAYHGFVKKDVPVVINSTLTDEKKS